MLSYQSAIERKLGITNPTATRLYLIALSAVPYAFLPRLNFTPTQASTRSLRSSTDFLLQTRPLSAAPISDNLPMYVMD